MSCLQATWQTVPNSWTGSAKASVSEAVYALTRELHGDGDDGITVVAQ